MHHKSYASTYSYNDSSRKMESSNKISKMEQVDLEEMAAVFIEEQNNKTKELEFQIKAYEIQIDA